MLITIQCTGSTKRALVPLLMALAVLAVVAPVLENAWSAEPEIVARVNGDLVTRVQFERMIANPLTLSQAQQELGVEAPDRQELERVAMQRLVRLRLLLQEAERRKITVTEEELDQAVNSLRRRFDSLKDFGAWVQDQGLNDPELFETVRGDILADRVTAALVEDVSITDEEAKKYFEAYRDELIIDAEIRMRIIAVDDKEEANEIVTAVQEGVPFDRLARKLSKGRLAEKGGDTGWVNLQTLPAFLQEAVVNLKPGEVRGPLEKNKDEFFIVGLQDRRPIRPKSFAEARPVIASNLLPEKRRKAIEAWLTEQEKNSKIEVLLQFRDDKKAEIRISKSETIPKQQ